MRILNRIILLMLLVPCAAHSAATWTSVGNFPSPNPPYERSYQRPIYAEFTRSATSYKGFILDEAGTVNCCGGTMSNAIYFYDPLGNSWTLLDSSGSLVGSNGASNLS